jgi:hypothetical protein
LAKGLQNRGFVKPSGILFGDNQHHYITLLLSVLTKHIPHEKVSTLYSSVNAYPAIL